MGRFRKPWKVVAARAWRRLSVSRSLYLGGMTGCELEVMLRVREVVAHRLMIIKLAGVAKTSSELDKSYQQLNKS